MSDRTAGANGTQPSRGETICRMSVVGLVARERCRDRRADRVSTAPEPEAPVPVCRDACRCGPPRSTPGPRSASESSFAQNAQNPSKRIGVHFVVDAHTAPAGKLDFDDPRLRSPSARCHARLSRRLRHGGRRHRVDLKRKQNRAVFPARSGARACLRHVNIRLCATPCRRATSHTTAPGISVSSTIRAFSSLLQRRRRSTPSTFPCISA